jgi:hypothetical protein
MDDRLAAVIRDEEFLRSIPPEEIARIAERRWASYVRRHPKAASPDDRIVDLAKGLRDHFEVDANLGGGAELREYEHFARRLALLLQDA